MDVRVSNPGPGGIQLADEPEFRLGSAMVDPAAHEVRFGHGVERIQAQPMRVLVALAQAKGNAVTRETIADRCWDGRIIGDDVINRAVLILRAVAKKSGAFEIRTIPRSGYRLIAVSQPVQSDRRRLMSIGACATLLAGMAAWTLLPRSSDRPRIMVAPIVSHLQGQTNLPAQIKATLIHALMDVGVAVDAMGSTKADYRITSEISASDGRIHVTVEMEDVRHRILILSRQFDRPMANAGAIPDEVAANIAANLAGISAPMSLERQQPVSPAILSNLLNLIYLHGTQADPLRAYQIAREMLPQAPNSAISQISVAISTAFVLGELPERDRSRALADARAAAAKAERLAPYFGDNQFAWCLLHPHVEFAACESHLRKGLQMDQAPTIAIALSLLQLETGRYEDALRLARMASSAEPYNPIKRDFLIQALEIGGRENDAAEAAARGLRGWPDHQAFIWNRVMGMSARGDLGAIERLDLATPENLVPYDRATVRTVLRAARGRDLQVLRHACVGTELRGSTRQVCMTALIQASDIDSAFAIADVLYPRLWARNNRETEALWLKKPETFPLTFLSSAAAAPMRRDPRFKIIAERSGLLAYWRYDRPDFCRFEDCSQLFR